MVFGPDARGLGQRSGPNFGKTRSCSLIIGFRLDSELAAASCCVLCFSLLMSIHTFLGVVVQNRQATGKEVSNILLRINLVFLIRISI
jgi:hypothetical protein